jgi:hypothetical protein
LLPDWLITCGIFAVLTGLVLRAVSMMRASDAVGTDAALHGRDLLRAFDRSFPRSPLPLIFRLLIIVGLASLLVGAWMRLKG